MLQHPFLWSYFSPYRSTSEHLSPSHRSWQKKTKKQNCYYTSLRVVKISHSCHWYYRPITLEIYAKIRLCGKFQVNSNVSDPPPPHRPRWGTFFRTGEAASRLFATPNQTHWRHPWVNVIRTMNIIKHNLLFTNFTCAVDTISYCPIFVKRKQVIKVIFFLCVCKIAKCVCHFQADVNGLPRCLT